MNGTGREWRTLSIIGLGVSTAPLDTSVNIAFPAITAAFGIEIAAIQWLVVCYGLTYSSILLGAGRLADRFGHRRVFVAGLLVSAIAFSSCALASRFEWLLPARVLQGIGAALVLGSGPALATLSFAPDRRRRVVALYMLAFAAAGALGPVVGGLLVERWNWPAVYWYRVPVAMVAAALALMFIDESPQTGAGPRFDIGGVAAVSVAVAAGLLALDRGARPGGSLALSLALAVAAGLCLVWFIHRQRSVDEPLVDPALFRDRAFAAINIAHILVNMASFVVMLLVPYYLVLARGAGLIDSGILLGAAPLGMMIAAAVAARALSTWNERLVGSIALAIAALGLAGIATLAATSSYPEVASWLLVQGFGHGLFQVTVLDRVMGTIARRYHGVAGSLTMMTRTVGVAMGASLGTLFFTALGGTGDVGGHGFFAAFRGTFWAALAVVVVSMVALSVAARRPNR